VHEVPHLQPCARDGDPARRESRRMSGSPPSCAHLQGETGRYTPGCVHTGSATDSQHRPLSGLDDAALRARLTSLVRTLTALIYEVAPPRVSDTTWRDTTRSWLCTAGWVWPGVFPAPPATSFRPRRVHRLRHAVLRHYRSGGGARDSGRGGAHRFYRRRKVPSLFSLFPSLLERQD